MQCDAKTKPKVNRITMDFHNSYCRLCAELKPSNKQVNLQSDAEKRGEISEKLSRINAATDFDEDSKPRTVCYECISALNKAFDFVIAIECAQSTLNQIFLLQSVKKEKFESGTEETAQDISDAKIHVKTVLKREREEEDNFSEPDDNSRDSSVSSEEEKKPKRVKPSKLDIDSIPLAQLSKYKLTWSSYSWFCTYCETLFSTIDELRTHSIEVHNICNPYRCTDCKVRKIRLDSFLIHVQRHHKHLKYSCYKCFMQFNTPTLARKHKTTHVDSKIICVGCNSTFPNNEELNKHVDAYCQSKRAREVPSLLVSGLTCAVCQKEFKTKSGLNTHVMIHTERKKEHTCEVCGKGFFLKYNLASHMVMHKDERPHKCQICNTAFKTARLLKNHVGIHNNVKPYSCEQCGRCFRLRRQLDSHRIIHTDILPYMCPHCNKRFRFKTILNNHVRLHTGIKPYSCAFCQREFSNWSNYNKHMKRKHGLDTSKKKHTPDGVYPIDPNTGDVIIHQETDQMAEWKRKMTTHRGLGRPRKSSTENIESTSQNT